jgi:hypothetical protein
MDCCEGTSVSVTIFDYICVGNSSAESSVTLPYINWFYT